MGQKVSKIVIIGSNARFFAELFQDKLREKNIYLPVECRNFVEEKESEENLLVFLNGENCIKGSKKYVVGPQRCKFNHPFVGAIGSQYMQTHAKEFVGVLIAKYLVEDRTEQVKHSTASVSIRTPDTADGEVSIISEVEFLRSLISYQVGSFHEKSSAQNICDRILRSIVSINEKVNICNEEYRKWINVIDFYCRQGLPIPIGFAIFIGRAPNFLKFANPYSTFPHYGWLYLNYLCKLIDEKVRLIAGYAPGIKVILFEEGDLFKRFLNGDFDYVSQQKLVDNVRQFAYLMESPLVIIPMSEEYFPENEVGKIEQPQVIPEMIYAMSCSLNANKYPETMASLYVTRNRDYSEIQKEYDERIGPEYWLKCEQIQKRILQALAYRKKTDLFGQFTAKHYGFSSSLIAPFLDACITKKDDRIVWDISGGSFYSNGMPLLSRKKNGKVAIKIEPEYRVDKNGKYSHYRFPVYNDYRPVYTFYAGEKHVFFYEKNI